MKQIILIILTIWLVKKQGVTFIPRMVDVLIDLIKENCTKILPTDKLYRFK